MSRIVISGASSTVDNHQPLIQRALDAVDADGGGVVEITDGTHYLGSSLKIGSNTELRMAPAVELVRNFSGLGETNATIQNKNLAAGTDNVNIRISGGTIRALDSTKTGKHIALAKVTVVSLQGTRFLSVFGDWTTVFRDCRDVTVSNVVIISDGTTTFQDGLHFFGGERIAVTNCLISTGDDAIAFTMEDVTPAPSPVVPIADAVVSNCYLSSIRANAVRIWIRDNISNTSIRRIRISNIVAKTGVNSTGGGGLLIDNHGVTNTFITDVEVAGMYLDASLNFTTASLIYRCQRVRLERFFARRPMYRIEVDGSTDVELLDCVVDAPRGAGSQCVLVAGTISCDNVRIIGGTFRAATNHGIQLGTSTLFVNGFEVRGALIEEASLFGVYVWNAFEGLVSNNTINTCAGWGIFEDPTLANNNLFLGNRLFGNTSGPISFGGANSQAIRNVAEAGKEVPDSGGFRQTIDSWYRNGTLSGLTNVEIGRNGLAAPDGRFRAVRPGSVTGLVITSSALQTAGTLTAKVYKNTGLAGAAVGSGTVTDTLVAAVLDGTNRSRHAVTKPMDTVAAKFIAGDELFVVLSTSTNPPDPATWAPAAANIRCAIEIED